MRCLRQHKLIDINRNSVVLAACATSTAGVLVFALLPIFIGQIASRHGLPDGDAGLSASAYFAIYALISLSAPTWIRRLNWRKVALAGYLVMVAGLTTLYLAESQFTILGAMAVTGAGAATLLPISLTLVSDMDQTERAYAVTIFVSQLIPALLLILISSGAVGQYNLENTIFAAIALTLICIALSYNLPPGQPRAVLAIAHDNLFLPILSLIALSVSFAGFAAMWAFFEIIAGQADLPAEFSALWIAIGLVMTAVGPIIAGWMSDRFGRVIPIAVPTLVALCASSLFAVGVNTTTYPIALVLFPLGYYVALIYILAIIAEADPKGTYSSLMSFALAIGAITGPAVYGFVKESDGPDTAVIAILLLIGAGLIIFVQHRLAQRS